MYNMRIQNFCSFRGWLTTIASNFYSQQGAHYRYSQGIEIDSEKFTAKSQNVIGSHNFLRKRFCTRIFTTLARLKHMVKDAYLLGTKFIIIAYYI